MEKNSNKVKRFFKWLVLTNLGRMLVAFLWVITFIGIDKGFEPDNHWAFWVSLVGQIYFCGFILIAIVFAWIINPIREYKEMKKIKEDMKNGL